MVTAVVLTWNGREDTLACLASLERANGRPDATIVVDNGSSDGTAEAVRERFPQVELVRSEENLGFAGGMNLGIRRALEGGADQVLTLNNDMEVEPGFLEPLVGALASDRGTAAACAQVLFADEPARIWYAGAAYHPRRGYQGRHTGYGDPPLPASHQPYATGRACAGAMLAPRTVLERVGLFDEPLFAYSEDVDWSLRARAAGLRVVVVPASVIRHRVSASTGGESSPATLYYNLRNSLTVAERHAPLGGLGTWQRRLVAFAAHLAQALLSRRKRAGVVAVVGGWRDFRRGRLGAWR
jgi:GT2 family glycosyltransferase